MISEKSRDCPFTFGVQVSSRDIALLWHDTNSNLHAEVSISFMPSPQIAYPHEIGSVSVH